MWRQAELLLISFTSDLIISIVNGHTSAPVTMHQACDDLWTMARILVWLSKADKAQLYACYHVKLDQPVSQARVGNSRFYGNSSKIVNDQSK